MALEAAAADGSWVAFCEADRDTNHDGRIAVRVGQRGRLSGDRLESYLAVGDGAPERIDELLAFDPSGRFVVVREHGRALLVDTRTGKKTDLTALGADTRDDALPYRNHRTLSFDATGRHLLYVKGRGAKARAVVRDLSTGAEKVIDPGAGDVWRAELDPSGTWVVLQMIASDTNGDGKLEWPAPEVRSNDWRCHGPVPTYAAWIDRGDTPEVRVARASGGIATPIAGFVAPFGRALLVRDTNGALWLRRSAQHRVRLDDAKCGARVLDPDVAHRLVLVACTAPKGRPKLELVGAGYRQPLNDDLASLDFDHWPKLLPRRLFAFYPGSDTAVVDFQTRKVSVLDPGDQVVQTAGTRVLVRRGRRLVLHDVASGHETALPGKTAALPDVLRAGTDAFVTPLVVDVAAGKELGKVSGQPLALASDGRALVARGRGADATHLAVGPLVWKTPR